MAQKNEQRISEHLSSETKDHLVKSILVDHQENNYYGAFEQIPRNIHQKEDDIVSESFCCCGTAKKRCGRHKNRKRPHQLEIKLIDKNKIFSFVSPKRGQKGNKNFVKFLVKSFFKHHKKFSDSFCSQFIGYLSELRNKVYARGSKQVTLKSLISIVGGEKNATIEQIWSRRVLGGILSSSSLQKEDIIQSHFIKKVADKKQQLIATKIYRARLCHSSLVARIQTR